jgi:hypothetical protein
VTGYLGKTTNLQRDVIGQQAEVEREDQIGPMPGEVKAYYPDRGTVDVQPLFKRKKWDGSPLEYPELKEVPVDFVRGGSSAITHPIPVGTRVMLNPTMRSSENYETEDDGEPSDVRSFNLSDMRASLGGGDSLSTPLPNVDPSNTHMRFDGEGKFGVRGSPDGKVMIEGSEGNIYDLLATAIELIASDGLNIKSGSSAGFGIHELEHRAALTEIAGKLRAMAL